jgi:hypothetical protein
MRFQIDLTQTVELIDEIASVVRDHHFDFDRWVRKRLLDSSLE